MESPNFIMHKVGNIYKLEKPSLSTANSFMLLAISPGNLLGQMACILPDYLIK